MRDEGEEAQEERVRSHSARAAMLDLLAGDEGELSVDEIRAGLPDGPPPGSVHYHLRVLEASDLIARDGDRYKLR